jgi:hypothetical protein
MDTTDPSKNITGDIDGSDSTAGQQVPIENNTPNQGAQGVFNAPVQIGDTHHVDTGGGDYAEGDIHKHYHPPHRTTVPAFQVPYPPNSLFIGRDAQLAALAQMLTENATAVVAPVIAGMGGVGKTQLASEFAHRQRAAFPGGVFWLNMEQPETIENQLALCAGPGGLDVSDYDDLNPDQRRELVKAAWAQATPRRLVVFDNLEDPRILKQYRPFVGSSCLLITSRRDEWPAQLKRIRLTEYTDPIENQTTPMT